MREGPDWGVVNIRFYVASGHDRMINERTSTASFWTRDIHLYKRNSVNYTTSLKKSSIALQARVPNEDHVIKTAHQRSLASPLKYKHSRNQFFRKDTHNI